MAKQKSSFVCQNCGAISAKWIGKCPSCNEWNTFTEEIVNDSRSKSNKIQSSSSIPIPLSQIEIGKFKRTPTSIKEFNRVLGGGIVPGSVILLGGEPGIGKSTLLLQIAILSNDSVLYISGEESPEQIKLRAQRLGIDNQNTLLLSETHLESIIEHIKTIKPKLVIIDSIQTLYSSKVESIPSSITQIRECAYDLTNIAKALAIPMILIGHINKEGGIAGPKVLEHIVDTVLQFEGDRNFVFRIVRCIKNRYGSTSEVGIFEMKENGLNEVLNPTDILVQNHLHTISGSAICTTIEGVRPMLVEIQALVSSAVYGTPQRVANGVDNRRLNMLLAVLEKKGRLKLTTKDVFVNIAGGLKISDPSIDLALIAAIISSDVEIPIDKTTCFSGEIGLSGEVRPSPKIAERILEAERLGYKKIFISSYNNKNDIPKNAIIIQTISSVSELLKQLFKH